MSRVPIRLPRSWKLKRRKPVRKKTSARKLKQQCDLLVREKLFARDSNQCVASGQAGVFCNTHGRILQAAHVLPKGKHQRLRWELDNLLTLCFFHHLIWAHKDPLAFSSWFHEKYPGREARLRELAKIAQKVNLKELYAELRGEAS